MECLLNYKVLFKYLSYCYLCNLDNSFVANVGWTCQNYINHWILYIIFVGVNNLFNIMPIGEIILREYEQFYVSGYVVLDIKFFKRIV